jgi:chaperonin cofactor prefoldin
MSTKVSKLKEFIRNLIKQELKELEEASVTGNLDGGEGPPRTPYAFYGGRKKDKEKKKRIAQAGGYMKVKESVNEAGMELNKLKDAIKMFQKKIDKQGRVTNARDEEHLKNLIKLYIQMGGKGIKESISEGKYHQYRNDETMTPKQKIGRSMREIRDSLNELDKLVKMNVRLKNELNVDSRSYWKNTHKALGKISERLVKLANKVGQLK